MDTTSLDGLNDLVGAGAAIMFIIVAVGVILTFVTFVSFLKMMDNINEMRKILQKWDEEGLPETEQKPTLPAE